MSELFERQADKDSPFWGRLRSVATSIGRLIHPERRHTALLSDLHPENDTRFRGGRYVIETVSGPTVHPEDWDAVPMLRQGGIIDDIFAGNFQDPLDKPPQS